MRLGRGPHERAGMFSRSGTNTAIPASASKVIAIARESACAAAVRDNIRARDERAMSRPARISMFMSAAPKSPRRPNRPSRSVLC